MSGAVLKTLGLLILILSFSMTSFAARHGRQSSRQVGAGDINVYSPRSTDYLTYFLEEELEVDDVRDFDLTLKTQNMTPAFSKESVAAVSHIYNAVMKSSYAMAAILGMPGVGKTFLNNQLAFIFSRGDFPDYYRQALKIDNPYFAKQQKAFIGKTRIILINRELLNRPIASEAGNAYNKSEDRQASVLLGLTKAAERQFQKHGQRTIFLLDEVATLPDGLQDTIKTLGDKTGWHDPQDPASHGKDVGYHFVISTTPYEFRAMEKADGAIRRRYELFNMLETSEAAALSVLVDKADELKSRYSGLEVSVEALNYLIKMRTLFDVTVAAMPGSVLQALEGLYPWVASKKDLVKNGIIDLHAAQEFVNFKVGLTSIWLPGPNGEPPLKGLEAKVKQLVKGQDVTVDKISEAIKSWARSGMDGPVPIFFIGGPSGSGKDTLFQAFNQVLFGHTGKEMMFSIGGAKDFAVDSLINGPPLGNHSDARVPTIIQRMTDGNPNSLIGFNEGKDCPSEEMDKLKVTLERGYMQSMGIDPRPYRFRFPIFIMGQWGEELFGNKTDNEIRAKIEALDQKQIDNLFLNPTPSTKGLVSKAFLQRSKVNGGVFLIGPVTKEHYVEIVQNLVADIQREQLDRNNIKIEVSPKFAPFVVAITDKLGEDTRGLKGSTKNLLWGAISRAMESGLPAIDMRVKVDVKKGMVVVQHLDSAGKVIKSHSMNPSQIHLSKFCPDTLNSI